MKIKALLICLLLPSLAHAHGGHVEAANFGSGFMHTLSGLDHVLALIVGGVWMSRLNLQSKMCVIAGYAMLTLVAIIAGSFIAPWQFDWSLLATIVVMCTFMAVTRRWHTGLGIVLLFGGFFLHGLAHGTEVLTGSDSWLAVTGVVASGMLVLISAAYIASLALNWLSSILKVKA